MAEQRDRPTQLERNRPLDRFSTLRTGGAAEWFARAEREEIVLELLRWADGNGLPVTVLGSGSNLLIADEGVSGLVVKLDGELAEIRHVGRCLRCGGGARLPSVAAHAARAGLSGIEFGVNIPGSVGGAVKMNANAYGGRLADVLESARVATAAGVDVRAPRDLRFRYRGSGLRDGEVVTFATFVLVPASVESVKATIASMRTRRHQAQPRGIRTFGSTFKNPEQDESGDDARGAGTGGDGMRGDGTRGAATRDLRAQGAGGPSARPRTAGELLSAAGCNGLQVGRARFAVKHANFVENLGGASTADVVALMAEGRRRVQERFGVELEPEVQTVGPVRFPWLRR